MHIVLLNQAHFKWSLFTDQLYFICIIFDPQNTGGAVAENTGNGSVCWINVGQGKRRWSNINSTFGPCCMLTNRAYLTMYFINVFITVFYPQMWWDTEGVAQLSSRVYCINVFPLFIYALYLVSCILYKYII